MPETLYFRIWEYDGALTYWAASSSEALSSRLDKIEINFDRGSLERVAADEIRRFARTPRAFFKKNGEPGPLCPDGTYMFSVLKPGEVTDEQVAYITESQRPEAA